VHAGLPDRRRCERCRQALDLSIHDDRWRTRPWGQFRVRHPGGTIAAAGGLTVGRSQLAEMSAGKGAVEGSLEVAITARPPEAISDRLGHEGRGGVSLAELGAALDERRTMSA
jgi:hypothetical protein